MNNKRVRSLNRKVVLLLQLRTDIFENKTKISSVNNQMVFVKDCRMQLIENKHDRR